MKNKMYETIKYNTDEEWLKIRQQGIGGSDVAILLGASTYKTLLELWHEKRNNLQSFPEPEFNIAAERGRALESFILKVYEYITGSTIDKIDGVLRSKEYPFMQASLDGYVKDKNIIVDAKSINANAAKGWGEFDTEAVPVSYYLQMQHYMIVTGFKEAHLAAWFTAYDKLEIYPIIADTSIQQQIIDRVKDFWASINNNIPPAPAEARDILITYPKSNGKAIEINPVIKCKYQQLLVTKKERQKLEKEEIELQKEIKLFLGNDEILTDGDNTLITWKSSNAIKRLDAEALKKAHPDIYKEFMRKVEGNRRFLIKGKK
jgi:putative phage-type endonuclease